MLKPFCDVCGEPGNFTTKRFPRLAANLGLDVTILFENAVGSNHHVCSECLPEMLLGAAKTFEEAKVIVKEKTALVDAVDYSNVKRKLAERTAILDTKERELWARLTDHNNELASIKKRAEDDANEIKVLKAQVETLKNSFETKVRQEIASRIQALSDEKEDPEYAARVKRRESIRAS